MAEIQKVMCQQLLEEEEVEDQEKEAEEEEEQGHFHLPFQKSQ